MFEDKDETDASFERCVRLLHDHHGAVRAAFGSHNLRSLAYAVSYARHRGVPDHGYEVQLLYGMAEPVHAAIKRLGLRLRVYGPVGELVPGMAYLVRRLLENTSNESFVRHRFAEGRALDELRRGAGGGRAPRPHRRPVVDRRPTPPAPAPYDPEPLREWRRGAARAGFTVAVDAGARRAAGCGAGADRGGAGPHDRHHHLGRPGPDPDVVVATSASCTAADADAAVAAAVAAAPAWRRAPAVERAARPLPGRRLDAPAPRRPGRAPVLRGGQAVGPGRRRRLRGDRLLRVLRPRGAAPGGRRGDLVQSPPGEANRMTYQGKGVTAVIAPWNFPLAIPCGMTVAALAAGNPVILKPAEQTPGVAWRLAEALVAAGAPPGRVPAPPGAG